MKGRGTVQSAHDGPLKRLDGSLVYTVRIPNYVILYTL